jgi:hypothetical protein
MLAQQPAPISRRVNLFRGDDAIIHPLFQPAQRRTGSFQ